MIKQFKFTNKKWVKVFAYFLLLTYIILAATLLFFSPYRQAAQEINSVGNNPYNLIPFKTISDYIKASSYIHKSVWITNLFGNVLAFLPLGFLLPFLFTWFMKFHRTIIFVFLATTSVEILQFYTHVGSLDVDDIILNTLGGAIGYWLFFIFSLILLKIADKNITRNL